jgi:predicted nucleic acid-binding protein
MKYALDTNSVIMLLRENNSVCNAFDNAVERGDTFVIPPFVNFEIIRGFRYKSAPKKEAMYNYLKLMFPVGEMNLESWEHAAALYAELRRAGRTVEDADLLIAAFCIVGDYTLITNNTKHFEVIDGLQITDWS